MGNNLNGPRSEGTPNPEQTSQSPPEIDIPLTSIRPAARFEIPPPARPDGSEVVRAFMNDQQNSRLSEELDAGEWHLRWEAVLDHENPCQFVLSTGDRIALQCKGRWQLLAMDGRPVALGKLGPGEVVMESRTGRIYVVDPYGVVETRRQDSGAVEYVISISGGNEWQRAFFATEGRNFVVVSFMRAIDPHALPPHATLIEVDDLGEPMKVENQILVSMNQEAKHFFEASRAYAASLGRNLVLSLGDQIVNTSDFGRKIRARYSASPGFGPMSLDETGRIHALRRGEESFGLWVISPSGERDFALDFPKNLSLRLVPPAIGYDHRIYVSTDTEVLCISPDGKILWKRASGGSIAGLAVTSDNQLLVSAGPTLVSFDADGNRRVIYEFTGDRLRTPPISIRGGDILVASMKRLYRLTASER
jgi:hypothetical protein